MNFVDFVREGLCDPLGFFVMSYLLGAAMCATVDSGVGPGFNVWLLSWRPRFRYQVGVLVPRLAA